MARVLAMDQGTTSSRALIFDERGEVLGSGQREFAQSFPKLGWVEHGPEEIWESQWEAVLEALESAGCGAGEIDAIGITNQRETVVVWDRSSGKPLAPAIVWQDRRTADYCEVHRGEWEGEIRRRTGLLLDPYFSGTKVRWLLENIPGARERAEGGELCFGTVESWLVWKLTGGRSHLTDVSNASRTLLMDLGGLCWDDDLLGRFGIPRSMLAEIVSNSGEIAVTDGDVFGAEVPITGMAGDQQAALFGQRCFEPGMVKATYGTGCFLLMQTGEDPILSEHRLLTTVAWKLGDGPCKYALEGSVFTGGSVVQWIRDGLGLIGKSEEINALAESVDSNGGVYFVPAFTGLGAPHWDPNARGTISGLTRGSKAGHIARAALEGIAFQICDAVEAMVADTGLDVSTLRADGGASCSDLLMQIQSDLLGCEISRSGIAETTALGAAFLAGLGAGIWSGEGDFESMMRQSKRFVPRGDLEEIARRRKGWEAALRRSLGGAG